MNEALKATREIKSKDQPCAVSVFLSVQIFRFSTMEKLKVLYDLFVSQSFNRPFHRFVTSLAFLYRLVLLNRLFFSETVLLIFNSISFFFSKFL